MEPPPRPISVQRVARYYVLGDETAPERLFALHGYGQQARYFARHFRPHAGAGCCVVAPEALSRFYLDGAYRRVGASWITREARDADIADSIAYLDAVAAQACPDALRTVLFGFSQGAAMACRWAAHGATPFSRVVLWGGEVPPDLDLARYGSRLAGLLLVYGDADAFATPERIADTQARLTQAGVPFETLRYAGGHRLYAEPLAAALRTKG